MLDAKFQKLIDELVAFDGLKVWSVLVTIFGDLAPQKGQTLAGPDLSEIMDAIGVKPEAFRVALHRLRKDGWITTFKQGRISYHQLSDTARLETHSASFDIYDPCVPDVMRWAYVTPQKGAAIPESWLDLGTGGYVVATLPADVPDALVVDVARDAFPQWARDAVMPQAITDRYAQLMDLLSDIPSGLTEHQQLTLRIMVLHNWRRIVLRHSMQAAAFMGPDWRGAACRVRVHQWLVAMSKPESMAQHGEDVTEDA